MNTVKQNWDGEKEEIEKAFSYLPGMRVLSYFSHVQLLPTPRTTAHQAALAMGFPRQEQWSELFDIQGTLLAQRSKLRLLHWQVGSLALGPPEKPHSWYPSMLLP